MSNTSATGGYLKPAAVLDLNDQALNRFLQQLVVGVTGLDGTLVLPRWQAEPPTMPDFGTDWCAVGETRRSNDVFGYDFPHVGSAPTNAINDSIYRNGIIEVLCSFYGPNCQSKAELFSVGLQIAQNREVMQLNGFGLVECEDMVLAADLLHSRWIRRVDLPFKVRRAQQYSSYGILDIEASEVIVKDDTGAINLDIQVNPGSEILSPVFALDLNNQSIQAGLDKGNWHP